MTEKHPKDILVLVVEETELAARWLCGKLGFQRWETKETVVQSGNLVLKLEKESQTTEKNFGGFVHVALNAWDIDQALAECVEKGLDVDSDGGKPYFNPGVFGKGTRYFNISTPFGVPLEVCMRLDQRVGNPSRCIEGLGHIGLLVKSAEDSLAFYEQEGFQALCPLVVNKTPLADIHCVMVGRGETVLELFSAENPKKELPQVWSRIDRLILGAEKAKKLRGPDREKLEWI